MIRFLADENLNAYIVARLRRRLPQVDVITATESDLKGQSDPDLLDWAARENRVLLTHDVTTLIHFANERLRLNSKMPGVIGINRQLRIGDGIEDLLLITQCSEPAEWQGRIHFLPLR